MEFFFKPKGIALIGATPNPLKGGNAILKNITSGYKGPVYPVNPRYTEIDNITCYASVAKVPDPVDLAIVFVPGQFVSQVVRDCADRGIKGVMIESSGFAESGKQGQIMQQELTTFARKAGIRLWGPNCMGIVDAVNNQIFSFVSPALRENLIPGDVSLIVQSGMLSGAFLIDCMSRGTMGISKVCSIGNKMDVDECELLEYFITDPDTRVIGLYLESITSGRKFKNICRSSPKPVVLLKGGKSAMGARAAMGHTASMAGNGAIISGAMAQAGVIEAKDFQQMMDICRALAAYPDIKTPGKGRVAVLTYSGGAGIVSSDFMDDMGIELATLSSDSKQVLKQVFPEWMSPSNPIDLWPTVEQNGAAKAYAAAIQAAVADVGVDAVFIHAFSGGFALNLDMETLTVPAKAAGKPVFCWLIGEAAAARAFHIKTQDCGIPVYRELFRAVECMDAVFTRKAILEKRSKTKKTDSLTPLPESIGPLLNVGSGVLDEHTSKKILAACHILVAKEKIVDSAAHAQRTADMDLGFPVVMKGLAAGTIHKTEAGLVMLDIGSENQIKNAFDALQSAMDGRGEILIQQQVSGDLELIAGLVRDPQFGPCVMVGLGGVMTEILDDAVFGVAPLDHSAALDLIDRLKHQKLLNGFRGASAVDRQALAKILITLGQLGLQYPNITEIDINPLIIHNGTPVAVDAAIVLQD
jgi:acetyltransferase